MAAARRGLTVAVTGPTGDIGRSADPRARALARRRAHRRDGAPAVRPGRARLEAHRVPARRRAGPRLGGRAGRRRRRRRAPRVHHLRRPRRDARDQPQGLAQRVRGGVAAGAKRLVYTSSVAAYGFHDGQPGRAHGGRAAARNAATSTTRPRRPSSRPLLAEVVTGSATDAYVFRPCIVAGRDAPTLIEGFTGQTVLGPRMRRLWRALDSLPLVGPVLPDTGVPFQLVHHDDVATAIRAAVLGRGTPGTYNLASEDPITVEDVAHALGWRCAAACRGAAVGAARRGRVPGRRSFPAEARWINVAAQAGADGHRQGAPRAPLAAAPRRRGDAARDGRGRAGRRDRLSATRRSCGGRRLRPARA